jgi:N-acyl-D-aspartate/D-glutamate deacylase
VTPTWTTLGGYFEALEKRGIAVNVASYAGLGTLLGCVLGDALARPDAAQLQAMKELLDEAMRDGAIGLSTMLASPRELAVTTEDLVELARVVQRHGGLYSSHIRNEGLEVIAADTEAIEIGRRAGVPVDIIHIKIADQALWHHMNEIVGLIDRARREGVNVQANVYPYTRGNNDLVSIIPPWAHEGGKTELLARLKDRSVRDRLKREIRAGLPGWYNHYTAVGGDWSRMLISAHLSAANRQFEGQTMDRIIAAKTAGRASVPDPLEVLFDFLIQEQGAIGTIYAHHTEEDMNLVLVQPWCSIGSDGTALAIEGPLRSGHPHPRSFGTFARVLGEYVRHRRLLRLEDAVRKMTSLNAAKAGLVDRGLLRPGLLADITIFDPNTVIDHATYLDPFQYSTGIVSVIVNGRIVLDRGQHTHAHPGRALRHGR